MKQLSDKQIKIVITLTIISIFFITYITIYGYRDPRKRNSFIKAEILKIDKVNSLTYLKLMYEIDEESYINTFKTDKKIYNINNVSLFYDENNIKNIDLYKDNEPVNLTVIPLMFFWCIIFYIIFYLAI